MLGEGPTDHTRLGDTVDGRDTPLVRVNEGGVGDLGEYILLNSADSSSLSEFYGHS